LTFDKIVEGGDEFDLGEVASDAEDDERKVVHEPQFSIGVYWSEGGIYVVSQKG